MHVVTYELQEELSHLSEDAHDALALATERLLRRNSYISSLTIMPDGQEALAALLPNVSPRVYTDAIRPRLIAGKFAGLYAITACFLSTLDRTDGGSHPVANFIAYDYSPSQDPALPGKVAPYAASISPLPTRDQAGMVTQYEMPESYLTLDTVADAVGGALTEYMLDGLPAGMRLIACTTPQYI